MADLSITAGTVAWVSGTTPQLVTGGESFTAGQALYQTGGQYLKAKSNAAGKKAPTAVALSSGALNGYAIVAFAGATINSGATITAGLPYFLSGTNAGGIAPVADLASGWDTVVIGFGGTTANMVLTFTTPSVATT